MKNRKFKLYFIIFSMIISSCNDNHLIGEYKIDKIVGDTVFQNYVKQIRLLPNNVIIIKSKNKLLTGKWVNKEGTDYHIIEVKVNGIFKQMQVYEYALNDPSIKLYFIGAPTDFQGGYYDSLSFIKVK